MRKIVRSLAPALCWGSFLGLLLAFPAQSLAAARGACLLWGAKVVPALFPYAVVSQMLLSALPTKGLLVPLAMLGGSPQGARLILQSGARGARAQRLAALCVTVSPLFLLGSLGQDARLLLAHWGGAVFAWAVTAPCFRQNEDAPDGARSSVTLTEAIATSAQAMVHVCACMAFFAVVGCLVSCVLPLSSVADAALMSVLEMAGGTARILQLGLPQKQTAACLVAAVSFGGCSIILQNAPSLRAAGVSMKGQLLARVVHVFAAYGLCWLLY